MFAKENICHDSSIFHLSEEFANIFFIKEI